MSVTHDFVSAKADGADASVLRPSNWNANHNIAGWDDVRVEPVVRSTGAYVPPFEQYFTDGAGSRGLYLLSFDDAILTAQKEVFFSLQMPHGWNGDDIKPHIHWVPAVGATAKAVRWGLEYNWAEIGGTFGNSTIVHTTTTSPADANLVANKHYISAFPALSPSTGQDGLSAILMGRLFRDSAHADDTYTGKCGLLYIDFHYQFDAIGSNSEFAK